MEWPGKVHADEVVVVKNTECTVYVTTKRGWTQSYRKEKSGWTQTCSNGSVRSLTAEQLLSHILPLLVDDDSAHPDVRVEPDEKEAVALTGEIDG
jgi:hypothetical protein